jgi:hypothetical protein
VRHNQLVVNLTWFRRSGMKLDEGRSPPVGWGCWPGSRWFVLSS